MPTRLRPTARAFTIGFGALLLFAVGTNVQAGWVLVFAALLLGVLIAGIVLPLRALDGIKVDREVPRSATAGHRVPVTLVVRNSGRRNRGMFRVTDEFCGTGWAVVSSIAPGGSAAFNDRRPRARRGVYENGIAVLQTGFPFGLMRLRRKIRVSSPLIVHPRVYEVPERVVGGAGGWHAPAAFGDVSSVRDYRPGDPLRHIHWRSVARRGQLMVREFDRERRADVAVVGHVPDDPDTADAIASAAASLAIAALRSGEVELIAADGVTPARSVEGILDWGARLSAGAKPLADVLGSLRSGSGVVCVAPADARGLDRLAEQASSVSVLAVLVGPPGAEAAARLRASGVTVAEVRAEEVETWFRNGCAAA